MILLAVLIIGISFIEIKKRLRNWSKNEMAVFFASLLAAFAMGVYYLSNPHRSSFTKILLSILHIPQ